MRIRSVKHNNRKKAFEIKTSNRILQFRYSKIDLQPSGDDPSDRVYVDKELASEGFTYVLTSGKSGTVHIEQVLEYNHDPRYLLDVMLYKQTVEAQQRLQSKATRRLNSSGLSDA
jgi:hypothetical protein